MELQQNLKKLNLAIKQNILSKTIYNLTNIIIRNTYSLEGVCDNIYGYNGNGSIIEQSSIKTSEELKLLASALGSAFEEDGNNINNGFPILKWQSK